MNERENALAVFIDFENLALGLKGKKDKRFDIQKVLERLVEKGNGFNNNESNLQLVDTPQGTQLVRTEDLARDGQQLFVKLSYLLQP